MENNIYTLMNKNQPILDFEYDQEIHAITKIDKIYPEGEKYASLGIMNYKQGITRQLLNNWWKGRSIPASRQGIESVKEKYHIDDFDDLILKSFGASLSDQYWVKPNDSELTWNEINFFDNDFSEDLGEALLGNKFSDHVLDARTPDATSDGNLKKRWKIENGQRVLIKGGNDVFNQEPFNEVVATKLYERLLSEDEYVRYELVQDNGNYYSKCANFIKSTEELVPAIHIDMTKKSRTNDSLYSRYVECCDSLGIKGTKDFLNKMIVCDYILGNYDRHYRNFGAIRNVETLEWERHAPLFDTGSSLWANSAQIDIGNPYHAKPFKKDALQQLELVDDMSWFDKDKLDGFADEMKSILSLNPKMDQERINKIANAVEQRINKVIFLSKIIENKNLKLSLSDRKKIAKEKKKEVPIKSHSHNDIGFDR